MIPISNPCDLRIDNIVQVKSGSYYQVRADDLLHRYKHPVMNGDYGLYPIPLTEDILAKCMLEGEVWKYALCKNMYRDGSGRYDGYYLSLKYSSHRVYLPVVISIPYLHTLQNVYWLIEKKELNMKL